MYIKSGTIITIAILLVAMFLLEQSRAVAGEKAENWPHRASWESGLSASGAQKGP
jgi:hypothetical protein